MSFKPIGCSKAKGAGALCTGTIPNAPRWLCESCWARAQIRRFGATPVFLVQPTPTVQTEMTFRGKPPGTVISFNNARLYPNLYRADVRIDRAHINKAGAEEFTRLMAAKFAQLLSEGKIQ